VVAVHGVHTCCSPMALLQSALSELLDAFRASDGP